MVLHQAHHRSCCCGQRTRRPLACKAVAVVEYGEQRLPYSDYLYKQRRTKANSRIFYDFAFSCYGFVNHFSVTSVDVEHFYLHTYATVFYFNL